MKLHIYPLACLGLFLLMAVSFHVNAAESTQPVDCNIQPYENLDLPPEAGEFLYADDDRNVISATGRFSTRHPFNSTWRISPNGMAIAGRYVPNPEENFEAVFVLDRSGNRVYSGAASASSISDVRWLGTDRLISFILIRRGRTSSLRPVLGFGYSIIEPYQLRYQFTYVPPTDRNNPFMQGNWWFFQSPYLFTYDGRYLFDLHQSIFDFETRQPLELANYVEGIPSSTSRKFLVVEYTNRRYETPDPTRIHPVSIYDADTDTLTQVTTLDSPAPASITLSYNEWSPDELMWAYSLYYGSDISFRRVQLLALHTGQSIPTCLGLHYQETSFVDDNMIFYGSGFTSPQMSWSRDSRYLALRGVLEGRDMAESLGVYIYDTQTEAIYEVYHGRADIIGWMANDGA